MPKTVAIIQARMGSSRLPGKVLLDIAGKPMIQHVIERTRLSHRLDSVIVATTTDSADDPIADFAASISAPCTRGSLHDVLDRYYQAAHAHNAEIVVRITADCPLIDPEIIDQTIDLIRQPSTLNLQPSDFACNRLPPPLTRSFPIGLDVEVCTFSALKRAWHEANEKYQREHVMPYLYEGVELNQHMPLEDNHAMSISTGISMHGFRITQLHHTPDYGNLRWTVDTPEDLELMRRIFACLGRKDFSWQDILALQKQQPEIFAVNLGVSHRTVFDVDERQQ